MMDQEGYGKGGEMMSEEAETCVGTFIGVPNSSRLSDAEKIAREIAKDERRERFAALALSGLIAAASRCDPKDGIPEPEWNGDLVGIAIDWAEALERGLYPDKQ